MTLYKKTEKDQFQVADFWDICDHWIETYPEDIFVKKPKEVVQIRELAKKLLKKRKNDG